MQSSSLAQPKVAVVGGEIYALLQRLDEEIEPSGVTWEGPPRRRKRLVVGSRLRPLLPLLGMVAVLLASDFYADTNASWLRHQVVSSIVTGFALSVAIIFGVERAIRVSDARAAVEKVKRRPRLFR